jgi:hypothetical protein
MALPSVEMSTASLVRVVRLPAMKVLFRRVNSLSDLMT